MAMMRNDLEAMRRERERSFRLLFIACAIASAIVLGVGGWAVLSVVR